MPSAKSALASSGACPSRSPWRIASSSDRVPAFRTRFVAAYASGGPAANWLARPSIAGVEVVVRDRLGDQAPLRGRGGAHLLGQQGHPGGPGPADGGRDEHGRTPVRHEADPGEGQHEARRLLGDREVGRHARSSSPRRPRCRSRPPAPPPGTSRWRAPSGWRRRACPGPAGTRRGSTSAPELKARPEPLSTITRAPDSSAFSTASAAACRISAVTEFSRSGRSKVMRRMSPCCSI